MNKNKQLEKKVILFGLTAVVVAVWLVPVLISIFTSSKTMSELAMQPRMWAPPKSWTLSNFATAWKQAKMDRYALNTLLITVPAIVINVLVGGLGAFAISFYRFRLNRTVLMIFVGGMLIPLQMLIIPMNRIANSLGVFNTYLGPILAHSSYLLGFCVFVLSRFMASVPYSLVEATRMDGASDFRIYAQIVLPMTMPAMAALAVLEFTWVWNDLLISLVMLFSDKVKTITQGLANMQGEYVSNYNITAAGALIAAAPPVIIYFLFQRYFISGMALGAEVG